MLVYSGLLLGGGGVLGGLVFRCVVSWIMTATRAVRFPPGLARVYMVDSIPLIPTPFHVAAIAAVCLLIVLLSSIWPAWKTSRQDLGPRSFSKKRQPLRYSAVPENRDGHVFFTSLSSARAEVSKKKNRNRLKMCDVWIITMCRMHP